MFRPTLSISSLWWLSILTTHDIPWWIFAKICNLWFYRCQCGPSDFLHNDAVWFHRSLGQLPQLLPTPRLCTEKEHAATVERLPLPVNPSKDRDLKVLALRRSKRSEKIHIPSSYVYRHEKGEILQIHVMYIIWFPVRLYDNMLFRMS